MQLSEKEAEVSKLAHLVDSLRAEKSALQDDAMHLSDRQMQLSHANRMLANELQEQQRGTGRAVATGAGASYSLFDGASSFNSQVDTPRDDVSGGVAGRSDGICRGGSHGSGDDGGVRANGVTAAAERARAHAEVLGRQRKPARHNVVDLREYEDVVAELAHRKLEIAFGKARAPPVLPWRLQLSCSTCCPPVTRP
jgi:hypothetical protein